MLDEREESQSEAYNDYLEQFELEDEAGEPMTFREWLNEQDEPDYELREDDGGGVYVE